MGSVQTHHSSASSTDGLNSELPSTLKSRPKKRLIEKFRSRKSSKSDSLNQTPFDIDPIKAQGAQNHIEGKENLNQDQTADVDQIKVELRDDEESLQNNSYVITPSKSEPVPDENRHVTCEETHTSTAESTKQNADKAVSCFSTATSERSRQQNTQQQLRESSEKITFGGQFDVEDYRTLIETGSRKRPHNWESDLNCASVRSSQGVSSENAIVAGKATSAELFLIDPESLDNNSSSFNSTIAKLEQLNLLNNLPHLEIFQHESLSFDSTISQYFEEDMPIVKKRAENGQPENGTDRRMFNVSLVKKVELSEYPLASDICTATEQKTVTSPTQSVVSGNGSSVKSPKANKSVEGKVLHRVITLTTANHIENNASGKKPSKPVPTFVPEKLHFSAYETFEGQMLTSWFSQSLQSIDGFMTTSLNDNDLSVLAHQYCSNLLEAGVIRHLDPSELNEEGFKTSSMYQWTYKNQATLVQPSPGKLDAGLVWVQSKTSPTRNREGESKIPKLMASTPKARIQIVSSLLTPNDQVAPATLFIASETDKNRVEDLKLNLGKCKTIQEMCLLIKSSLSENSMQSSESSSNSGVFNASILNGTESTLFDRSMETTVFNVLRNKTEQSPVRRTPPRGKQVKSRTSPSTPTDTVGRSDPKRFRRNLSADSVNSLASTSKSSDNVNGSRCQRCAQKLTSPKKTINKRMVDKATVMDVEAIEFLKTVTSTETQTESDIKEKDEIGGKETSVIPIPPPPPPIMNIPPPPPLPSAFSGAPNIPGPPPPPPPNLGNNNLLSNPPNPPHFPPPPAPPGGFSGSPMPLPPPIAFNTGPALRKNMRLPPKPMKPLYWTRIVAPIKSTDMSDSQSSLISEEKKEFEDEEELWKEIDETKLDNLDEFTELFSRQGVVPKAKTTVPLPKVKAIKVLDSKRSQNVGIFVRSIHVDFAEIEHAIYHCDTSVISLETLQHIMEIKASKEELLMIKEAVSNYTEGSPPLDAPESFLLKISEVSSSAERISCIVFQAEFEEQCTIVSRKLMTVTSLCEFLLENDGLKEVFSIILTLGNFMNGGNRQRGQADGFGLEILGKLRDVKSKDPKITLLHFIVKTYIERCRKSGCGIADLVLPIPNPNDVDKSLSIDFEECKQQLNALKSKVTECRKTTEKVVAGSAADCVQPFKEKMETFIEMAIKKIESRLRKLDECQIVFIKTIKFYMFTPKKGTLEETAPAQFFEYWTSFTSDFNDIYKKEIAILTNELLKKTRQITKPQSKPASGENNLKARINRLKNRNN